MDAKNLARASVLERRLKSLRSVQIAIETGKIGGDHRDTRLERLAAMFHEDDLDMDRLCEFIVGMIQPRIEETLAEVAQL